jgi:hypothetical protein
MKGTPMRAFDLLRWSGNFALSAALLTVMAACLNAQIGYPSPYPRFPGQSPYPGSGGPNSNGNGGNTGRGNSRTNRGKKEAPPTVTTTGMLRLVSGSQFVLEADDHRIITYNTTGQTKVEKDGKPVELNTLAMGDHFTVDSTADEDGYFTAAAVIFNLAGTAADREAAARTWDLPTFARKPSSAAAGSRTSSGSRDDDDRPVLRRTSKGSDASQGGESPSPASTASQSANATGAANRAPTPQQAPEEIADNRPTTVVRPNDPPPDADDPGKPVLRRGRPAPRPSTAADADAGVSSATDANASAPVAMASAGTPNVGAPGSPSRAASPRFSDAPAGVIPIEEDPVIAKAKAAAQDYVGTLPNFFCRQLTTRFETENAKDGWQALDTVTADLAYENGRESYQNIKIGNKTVSGSMDQIPGSSSSGEFSSILEDLFDASTAASFRKSGQDSLRGRSSYTYKFEVKRENSHWRVVSGGQLYYPAYRGTVWIDRETARVTRIEMESRNMPVLFPFDKVETAVDYDFVRLSTPEQFLMPVTAEVLSCEQSSNRCLRNRIEFRNYRKFGAESEITFGN